MNNPTHKDTSALERAHQTPRSEAWANKELARSRRDMNEGLNEWFESNRRKGQ